MTLTENTGDHPSKLLINQLLTGELTGEAAESTADWVDNHPDGQAHKAAVEAAAGEVSSFDASALRSRARAQPAEAPVPANNNRAFLAMVPVLLLAAIVLMVAWPALMGAPEDGAIDPTYTGTRATVGLQIFHLEPQGLASYDDRALGQGDVLGFQVTPGDHEGVVVLSVDGNGQVSVFYPETGGVPEPVSGTGTVALPGSVVLDGAPGPETFIAVFDIPVADARAEVERTWQSGGKAGLESWARDAGHVDIVTVNRK